MTTPTTAHDIADAMLPLVKLTNHCTAAALQELSDTYGESSQENENRQGAAWSRKVSDALRLLAEAATIRDDLQP
jgi:hypothetical protein